MASPSSQRVRVDAQRRMVIPQRLRDEVVTAPGEVLIRSTPDGLLLTSTTATGTLTLGEDGLPVLHLDRKIPNDEVLDALDRGRAESSSTPPR